AADHLPEVVRRDVEPGEDAEAAGAAHLRHELGPGDTPHTRLDDRVLDREQLAERRPEHAHSALPRASSRMACSRSLPRWTLSPCGPGVRGTSLTKRIPTGILYEAILPRAKARSAASVRNAPSFRITYATGASLSLGSGTPTTNACATSGCDIRNTSISPGATMKWRSEERRVGKECRLLCRSRWS